MQYDNRMLGKWAIPVILSILILGTLGLSQNAYAPSFAEIVKLTASDAAADDRFGRVSISGDTAIVGAEGNDDAGSFSGSAYIFVKSGTTWIQQAKLTASDADMSDSFGNSVSISGDTVIVGAPLDDEAGFNAGAAYIFVKPVGGWVDSTETAKLTALDAFTSDLFGRYVSISGDTAVVASIQDDDAGVSSGSAYVFVKPVGGWVDSTQTAKLTASDGFAFHGFSRLSISGDTAIVGAAGDDDGGFESGAAYVFVKPVGAWADSTQTAKLTASDAAPDDQFGASVSISGDTVIVGARTLIAGGNEAAYIFVKPVGGWVDSTQTAKLTASDAAVDDFFGHSVSISGDNAIVGALGDDNAGSRSGSAYIFVKPVGGWADSTQTAKITASDAAADDEFGRSVSISGDTAVVGAHFDDDAGEKSGSAYVFSTTTVINTDIDDNLDLGPDDSVIVDGATVNGNISVDGGTIIIQNGATITGNIETSNGASLTIDNANINGNVIATDSDPVSITNSDINGNIEVTDSQNVTVTGNIVNGNITIEGTTGSCTDSPNSVNGNTDGCP